MPDVKISPKFEGFRAIVTGGGRGIGAAIAAALTRNGAHVTVTGRHEESLAARVAAGEAAAFAVADVTAQTGFEAVIAKIMDDGPIDILVNNAGAAISAPFGQTGVTDFRKLFEINLLGPVTATRAVLPGMVERGFGRIINIASTAALKGYAYTSAYAASKHALLGLTRSLAVELAKTGVTVNAVCPGFTETDMLTGAIQNIVAKTGRSPEATRTEILKTNPLGRAITPAEVAETVMFLAGRDAGAITGTAITVAGGET